MTLPEMMVVLSLVGVIMSTAYLLLSTGSRIVDSLQARDTAVTEGQVAMERLTRELRQSYEISNGGGALAVNQARRCSFYVDLDHNDVPERITYYVSGTQLLRTTAAATTIVPPFTFGADSTPQVVVEDLKAGWSDAVFVYYDSSSPALVVNSSSPASVAAVSMHVVNQDTVGRSTAYCDLSTWVRLRTVHNAIQ